MSLIGALNTGQSALAASQAAIQVIGNNISNSGNADYTRQATETTPGPEQQIQTGVFVGTGVEISSIKRQIDDALESRLRGSISDTQSAQTTQQWLSQVQSVFNALGTNNLSTSMSSFFNSWSTLANTPQDMGQRQVVLQQGQALAQQFTAVRQQLTALGTSVSSDLSDAVKTADTLASQIASLNGQIVTASNGGTGSPNALLDQRDAALKQLSQLMNVTTQAQPDGSVSVYVGSQPLVTANVSNGVAIKNTDVNGVATPTVVFKSNGGTMPINGSGQLGGLSDMQARITGVVDQVDSLAHNLIYEVNQVYSGGQGLQGFTSVTATNSASDTTKSLADPASGLKFTPTNGSFVLHVTDPTTGQSTSTLVQVNLTGAAGDTTLDSLTASLNAIPGVKATDNGGQLQISATTPGQQLTFSQDSSGTLAAVGVNTFFTGTDASNIAVNQVVSTQPQLLAAAQNGDPGDNQTAVAIAGLASQPISGLGGASLNDNYQSMINGIATQAATAQSNAQAAQSVQDTLQSQRDSISGVSMDEEAVNLMKQQQAYQGAARLINVINQLMQSIISMTYP
ncbi:MAG TPA: flagellar hook-associated protein FlgK [Tepidisphaeraceae bacterium]|jgi:flagellar hook-associated protein 1 FlgK